MMAFLITWEEDRKKTFQRPNSQKLDPLESNYPIQLKHMRKFYSIVLHKIHFLKPVLITLAKYYIKIGFISVCVCICIYALLPCDLFIMKI